MKPERNTRLVRSVAAASVAGLCALGCWTAPVGAQDIGTLESRIAGARDQAQGLAADIETKTAALGEAQARAAAAAQREAELAGVLARGRERAAELADQVAEAEARLAEARERLRASIAILEERLVEIYKGEMPDATTLLLDAHGYEDLITRADYLQQIEAADASLVSRVRELREQVESELAAVREARARQEAFNQRVETAQTQIAAARADAEAEATALADARAAQADSLAGLRSQVDDWTAQVQELQEVSEAQAQQEVGDWVGDWAIPSSIVMCESGGNFGAVNPSSGAGGAYQILPSTWKLYGGEGRPNDASPAEDRADASRPRRSTRSARGAAG
jgi:hypothetical protein